tara:strand:- start:95785 stop:97794 length:2010 start_codon:yes stop_codon:yes gene_type:complete
MQIRKDIVFYQGAEDDFWTLHDLKRNVFYQVTQPVSLLLKKMQSTAIDQKDIPEDLLDFLKENEILSLRSGNRDSLYSRCKSKKKSFLTWVSSSGYLFFKKSIAVNPQFFRVFQPFVGLFSKTPFLFFIVLLTCGLLYLTARDVQSFFSVISSVMTPIGLSYFFVLLVCGKFLHELAHAVVASYYGVPVTQVGVALMVFIPILYTDTTVAWRQSSRAKRIKIALAGVTAEFLFAIVCLLAWHLTYDQVLKNALFLMATSTWVLSVLINANPLMKFDGYYVLSDALKIDNLQSRSYALGRWKLRELIFNLQDIPPEPPRLSLYAYCYAAWLYRIVLVFSIAFMLYVFMFKLLAVALVCLYIFQSVIRPIYNEVRYAMNHSSLHDNLSRKLGILAFIAFFTGLLFIPWGGTVVVPATHNAKESVSLYARVSGQIAYYPQQQQSFSENDVLLAINADERLQELAMVHHEIEELQLQYQLQGVLHIDGQSIEAKLVDALAKKEAIETELQQSQLIAPSGGEIHGLRDDFGIGDWIQKGQKIGQVTFGDESEIQAYINETDLQRIDLESDVVFLTMQDKQLTGQVDQVDTSSINYIEEPYVASTYGGELLTLQDERMPDRLRPLENTYRVTVKIMQSYPSRVDVGQALFQTVPESVIQRLYRGLIRLWRQESSF